MVASYAVARQNRKPVLLFDYFVARYQAFPNSVWDLHYTILDESSTEEARHEHPVTCL